MTTLNEFSINCGMSITDTADIFKEAGIKITGDNDHIPAAEMNKLLAHVATLGIHAALTRGGAKCESIIKSKCAVLWKNCPETRAEFGNDFSICESYFTGLARGSIGPRVGGKNYVH